MNYDEIKIHNGYNCSLCSHKHPLKAECREDKFCALEIDIAYQKGKSDGRAEVIEEFCEGYKNFQTDENICDLQEDCSMSGGWCIDCYKEHWIKEQNNERNLIR